MPRVLNLRDTNYKVPEGAIYVRRGNPHYGLPNSKWSNPFKVGKDGTREEVVQKYLEYLLETEHTTGLVLDIGELRGKDLVCWCCNWDGDGENPMYCHGDILVGLANA